MANVSQCWIGSVVHGSITKDLGSETFLRLDERMPVQDFELKVSCPVCQRDDVLMQIGGAIFCAACGYASDSAAGCT